MLTNKIHYVPNCITLCLVPKTILGFGRVPLTLRRSLSDNIRFCVVVLFRKMTADGPRGRFAFSLRLT